MEEQRAERIREQRPESTAREPARRGRKQGGETSPLLSLSRLRAAAALPDGLLELPPEQLRSMASALGNGTMSQLMESGPQPHLEDAAGLLTAPPDLPRASEISTAEPLLSGGPDSFPAGSGLPQASLCRISET